MIFFFEQRDFEFVPGFKLTDHSAASAANAANRILEERGVRVQGNKEAEYGTWHFSSHGWASQATHQALLINIEELPKPECEHEANWWGVDNGTSIVYEPICFKCKIKLKATWSPA